MKMEKYGFCSTTTHPFGFTDMLNSDEPPRLLNDPNLPLLSYGYEPEYPDPYSLQNAAQAQLTHPDFSFNSSTHLRSFPNPLPDHYLHRLPPLSASSPPIPKRTRLDLTLPNSDNNPQTLDSIVQSFKSRPPVIPYSELARKRRQKLSEKTRCLQKLMPWEKKMDTGTMLQEAYKYIRFLQAQVSVLQSMPITSSYPSTVNASFGFQEFSVLGRLNREQLLQVLVNSPVAQTMLCEQGFCVFASEQLVSLNKLKERKTLLQQYLCGN